MRSATFNNQSLTTFPDLHEESLLPQSSTAGLSACQSTLQKTMKPAKHLRVQLDSVADPKAVVAATRARFTVLTSRLLRLEFAADGHFEDRVQYYEQTVLRTGFE